MTPNERIEWRLRHDVVAEESWAAGTVARAIRARRAAGAAPVVIGPAVRRVETTRLGPKFAPSFGALLAVVMLVGAALLVRTWSVASPSPTPATTPTRAPSATPNAALDLIRTAGVLRIAVIGPVDGVHGQVAQAVADELGVRAELTSVPEAEVKTVDWGDRYDAAVGVIRTITLREKVLFTVSQYGYRPAWLVVAADSPYVTAADLEGRTICVRAGGEPESWLTGELSNVPIQATRIPVPGDADCVAELGSGSADAMLVDTLSADTVADARFRTIGDPVFVEQMTLAVPLLRPEVTGLLQPFDDLLTHGLWVDGTLPEILAGADDGTTSDAPKASAAPS